MNRRNLLRTGGAFAALSLIAAPLRAAPTAHNITISKFKFAPNKINVRVGDTITWTNEDGAPHTATAKDESWDTGTLKKGETSEPITVTAQMNKDYFCRFHRGMKARLRIKK